MGAADGRWPGVQENQSRNENTSEGGREIKMAGECQRKIRITKWPNSASGKGNTTNGRTVSGAVKEESKQTCVGCHLILQ